MKNISILQVSQNSCFIPRTLLKLDSGDNSRELSPDNSSPMIKNVNSLIANAVSLMIQNNAHTQALTERERFPIESCFHYKKLAQL